MIGWGFFAMLLAVSVIFLCFVLFITWSILKSCKYSRNVKSSVGSKDRLACVNKILFLQTGQQGILLTDTKHLLFWLVEFSWRQQGYFTCLWYGHQHQQELALTYFQDIQAISYKLLTCFICTVLTYRRANFELPQLQTFQRLRMIPTDSFIFAFLVSLLN